MKRGGGSRGNPLLLKRAGLLLLAAGFFLLVEKVAVGSELSHPPRLLVQVHSTENTSSDRSFLKASFSNSHSSPSISEKAYLPLTQTHVIEARDPEQTESLVHALESDPAVTHVEMDENIEAHLIPNDVFFNLQWSLGEGVGGIGAEKAWEIVNSADNIVVALIDSGCDFNHPELSNNIWTNSKEIPGNGIDDDGNGYIDDTRGYDFAERDNNPTDENGHGTMVFGIMGAVGNNQTGVAGIAWDVKVMCLRVLDDYLNGTVSLGAEAVEYAIANGANVMNLSWGYTPAGSPSAVLESAIQKAQAAGILVVTSAGNNSSENQPGVPGGANYPSSYPEDNIIAVAATSPQDDLSWMSNYGSQSVDLGAPGEEIYTTFPSNLFAYFTGTSASAPHVSGAAALVWTKNPSLDYKGIKQLILNNVDPLPSLSGKSVSGGRLNVLKALTATPGEGGQGDTGGSDASTDTVSHETVDSGGSGGCVFTPEITTAPSSKSLIPFLMLGLAFVVRRKKNE